jgi:hypothetical protein
MIISKNKNENNLNYSTYNYFKSIMIKKKIIIKNIIKDFDKNIFTKIQIE